MSRVHRIVGPPEAAAPSQAAPPDREALGAALRADPRWLTGDAALLSDLGLRPDLANLVDFGPIALSRSSEAHRRESSERQRLEGVARANYAAQAQTHAAVLDLLEAPSLGALAQVVDDLARRRFGLAAAVLGVEAAAPPEGWKRLARGQVDAIVGSHRLAVLGRCPTALGLFGPIGPQIGSVALLRLQIWSAPRAGVLAFGAFDPNALAEDMGSELVTFIARVVERMAERWPRP